jgi:hypothetical protein
MEGQANTHHCAMVAKGGQCCEDMSIQKQGPCPMGIVFGALVIIGLAAIITLQAKTMKLLKKNVKTK